MENDFNNAILSSGFLDTGYGGGRISKENPTLRKTLMQVFGLRKPPFDPLKDVNLTGSSAFSPLVETREPETEPRTGSYGGDATDKDVLGEGTDLYGGGRVTSTVIEELKDLQRNQAALSLEQAQQLYPLLQSAGREGTARNYLASRDFLKDKLDARKNLEAFQQELPTTQQDIVSAKQTQSSQASRAFLEEAMAAATQSDAAKRFAETGLSPYRYVGS
jgi:hypothetical protein